MRTRVKIKWLSQNLTLFTKFDIQYFAVLKLILHIKPYNFITQSHENSNKAQVFSQN